MDDPTLDPGQRFANEYGESPLSMTDGEWQAENEARAAIKQATGE